MSKTFRTQDEKDKAIASFKAAVEKDTAKEGKTNDAETKRDADRLAELESAQVTG